MLLEVVVEPTNMQEMAIFYDTKRSIVDLSKNENVGIGLVDMLSLFTFPIVKKDRFASSN
jgi:hypothetical protein